MARINAHSTTAPRLGADRDCDATDGGASECAPLGVDTGGPGAAVPGRWLGVGHPVREDRRKDDRGGYSVPGYRPSIVVRHERRSGKERRRPFTIEDHRGDAEERSGEDRRSIPQPDSSASWTLPILATASTDSMSGAAAKSAEAPLLRRMTVAPAVVPSGPLELVGPGFHFTHACDPYKRAENAQRWAAERHDDDTADFVASILQAEIDRDLLDRDLLARAQHPSHRRDVDRDSGVELHSATGVWGRLPDRDRPYQGPTNSWTPRSRRSRATREGGGLLASGARPSRAGALRLRLALTKRVLRMVTRWFCGLGRRHG